MQLVPVHSRALRSGFLHCLANLVNRAIIASTLHGDRSMTSPARMWIAAVFDRTAAFSSAAAAEEDHLRRASISTSAGTGRIYLQHCKCSGTPAFWHELVSNGYRERLCPGWHLPLVMISYRDEWARPSVLRAPGIL